MTSSQVLSLGLVEAVTHQAMVDRLSAQRSGVFCTSWTTLYIQLVQSQFLFLTDEYRLLPPAGMESYFPSCMHKMYVPVGSWLQSLWCF